MFAKTAEFYDLVYSFKDYQSEAAKIRELIIQNHSSAKTILDVACGTAEHSRFLSKDFSIDGIDLQPEFIAAASKKVPSGNFSVADMREFDLGKKYDVVQCLFSSIGYLKTAEDVVAALKCFRNHLAPEGIIIVEPWLTPEGFMPGVPHMSPPVNLPDLKIVRMNTSKREENLSQINFHYLIADKEDVKYVQENHELALYSVNEMLSFFDKAGLEVSHDPEGIFGRGLYLARLAA